MVISWIFTGFLFAAIFFSILTGSGSALASAVAEGSGAGIKLGISLAGSLCLWSGFGRLAEQIGLTDRISRLLRPVIRRLFPSCASDPALSRAVCGNICANLLGLGNAATPMGIRAVRLMPHREGCASNEMCRLIVLNTASIQLIPANVSAIRAALGCAAPFDILPAVWLTSFFSAGVGLAAAGILGRLWR